MKISLTVLFPLLVFLFSLKKKKERRRRRKRIVSLSLELNRSIKKKSSRIAQQITGSQRRPIPNRKSLLVSARYHPFSPSYTTNTKRSYYYTTNVPRVHFPLSKRQFLLERFSVIIFHGAGSEVPAG